MGKRKWSRLTKALFVLGGFTALSTLYLALSPLQEPCNCNEKETNEGRNAVNPKFGHALEDGHVRAGQKLLHKYDNPAWGSDRLAVIVPFRDRFEELMDFVPFLHRFLDMQQVRHKIFVMNQADVLRFNRGSLINVGYLLSRAECDYIAMHDVDLIPMNLNISYAKPAQGPYHASGPDLHPRYHYPTFVGGILLLSNEHFAKVNGFSNNYFGWGKEDDEFYVRMREANLTIFRPANITTGFNTFRHIHDKVLRPRDNKRYFDQKQKSRIRDRITGVDTVLYEVTGNYDIEILGAPATVIQVGFRCDLNRTPWCVTIELYQAIEDYIENKDKLLPKDVYKKAPNGTYAKSHVIYEKPSPPVDLKYFINLNLDKPKRTSTDNIDEKKLVNETNNSDLRGGKKSVDETNLGGKGERKPAKKTRLEWNS